MLIYTSFLEAGWFLSCEIQSWDSVIYKLKPQWIVLMRRTKKNVVSLSGNRTPLSALKGPYPNRWTNREHVPAEIPAYNSIEIYII
jgi:hypothetical protein